MEMSNWRPELHVAQRSRRDKLRIQPTSTPPHHLDHFPANLEQLAVNTGLNPDQIPPRSFRTGALMYDPSLYSSEILNYSSNSHILLAHKDGIAHLQSGAAPPARPVVADEASLGISSHPPLSSNFDVSSKVTGDPRWKSFGSQQGCDWIFNYTSAAADSERNSNNMFVGEALSGSLKVNTIHSESTLHVKPSNCNGYQDVQSSLTNPSSEISSDQDSQKHYGDLHFTSPQLYPNALQDVVTSASIRTPGLDMASLVGRGSWSDGGNELVFFPTYGNQSIRIDNATAAGWMNRPADDCSHQWSSELSFLGNKSDGVLRSVAGDSNTHGLSLSLSSNPRDEIDGDHFEERYGSEDLQSRPGCNINDSQDSKSMKSINYLCSNVKSLIGSCKGYGNSLQDIVGTSTYTQRNTGPLGPFTGYATILKSSKFLKPAQQLLDEFCCVSGAKFIKNSEKTSVVTERNSGGVGISADMGNAAETEIVAKGGNINFTSSTFYSSSGINGEAGAGSSTSESYRPEYQQMKAKLLYMQEEVCRRYRQYHQQMQMVVSSFESVAGLSAATPYISLALKTVTRHFKCLKNAISDQLMHKRKALGEDLSSPTSGTSSSKGNTSMSRLKFVDESFKKNKSGGDIGFLEPPQHIWRPQRGLPERAVAVLRAWLFDHFLHPYPTDTDKHMLATQTGLSRNQVSNWFINARVRVWKPMVEEIHMLETKGLADAGPTSGKNNAKLATEHASQATRPSNELNINVKSDKQVECPGPGCAVGAGDGSSAEPWNQEKRSRLECQIPPNMGGSLMGFVPYQHGGLEIGGLGAVSLTLGLRNNVESAQQQQQPELHQQLQQQGHHQLRQSFGGQLIHDFVG